MLILFSKSKAGNLFQFARIKPDCNRYNHRIQWGKLILICWCYANHYGDRFSDSHRICSPGENNFEIAHKTCSILVWGAVPLWCTELWLTVQKIILWNLNRNARTLKQDWPRCTCKTPMIHKQNKRHDRCWIISRNTKLFNLKRRGLMKVHIRMQCVGIYVWL